MSSDDNSPDKNIVEEEILDKKKSNWLIYSIILVILLIILTGIGWRILREISWMGMFVPVDDKIKSPQGTNNIRVRITNMEALGWGEIKIHQYHKLTGYSEIYSYPSAASEVNYHIIWLTEDQIQLTFIDPKNTPNEKVEIIDLN